MSANIVFQLKKQTPLEILEGFFNSLVELYQNERLDSININLNVQENWWSENLQNQQITSKSVIEHAKYAELTKLLSENPMVSITQFQISCSKHSGFIFSRQKEKLFDELTYKRDSNRDWDRTANFVLKTINILSKKFDLINDTDPAPDNFPPHLINQLSTYQNAIIETKKISEKMIGEIGGSALKWDESIRKSKEDLDKILIEKKGELEKEYNGKKQELATQEEAFRQEKSHFDTNTRTYVRRKLLEKIDSIIEAQNNFELSDGTNKKKSNVDTWLIRSFISFFILFLCFSGALTVTFFIKGVFEWRFLIPSASALVISVSMFIWHMRINNQWLHDHSTAELRNKKYAADIYRASWIVEMFYEWKDEKKSEMLPELLNSLTTDLFKSNPTSNGAGHPIEDVLGSLNKFGKVKLSKTGIEIETKKDKK